MIDGFKILEHNDVRDSLNEFYKKGALRGDYLGFPTFHQKYTMSLPGVTDWTGSGGSGKSEFLLELLLNTSLFYGWKHLIYVPDVGSREEIISILIHKKTGKTFDKRYKNVISEFEIEKELIWVLHYFKILYKEDKKKKITPYQFWDYAVELNKSLEGGIQTATIDSWKDMKRYVGRNGESIARDDLYLEDVLGYRNDLADVNKIHFHIVIHPLKTEKDKNGKRLPATPYDLKGGTTWFDSGKCMITVHREDGTFNEVSIIVNKAKPSSVAELGTTKFFFNKSIRKYYVEIDGEKRFAAKEYIKPIGLQISDDEDDEVPF